MRKSLLQLNKLYRHGILFLAVQLIATMHLAAQVKVKGTVTDDTGEGLPGVSIVIKGTTQGTITDIEGNYSLQVPSDDGTLVYTFIGYKAQEVPVNGRSMINIELEPDLTELDEVVVVGYGVAKKSDVTGALSSIDAQTIKERPVTNAIDAMQGKVAGVDITSNKRPGEVSSIRIRGNKSINNDQPVLYVVDGIILMGDLNDINPNDIESIDILKDASAQAIYGSRGANGVVLITTKRGKKGFRVNYNASFSFDVIRSLTDWASAGELLDRNRVAFQNHPSGRQYEYAYPNPEEDIATFGHGDYQMIDAIRQGYQWEDPGTYNNPVMRDASQEERDMGWPARVPVYNANDVPTFDWMDFLTRTGTTNNHNISARSGTENSNLYVSLGYTGNKGAQINQEFERFTGRINGEVRPKDWLKVGTSLAASHSEQLFGSVYRSGSATGPKDIYGIGTSMYPMSQPFDSVGELRIFPGNNQGQPVFNPLIDVNNTEDNRTRDYFQGSLTTEIKFTSWLRYQYNFGAGVKHYRRGQWQGKESTTQRGGVVPTATVSFRTDKTLSWLQEHLLYVDQTFGRHKINVTLLQSSQLQQFERFDGSGSGLLNDNPKWWGVGTGSLNSSSSDYWKKTLESYMGRINYAFADKYLVTATLRADGSSVLAPGNKWALFPSFAVAWKMEEEPFMEALPVISQMKLRVGYGIVGNSGSVDAYESSGPLAQYDYIFGTTPAVGYLPLFQPNDKLTWEKVGQTNIGLDFGFMEDRIYGSVEYYESTIFDLIFTRELPATTGYTNVTANIAEMQNKGLEFTLNSVNIDTRNFTWRTSVNFAANREKITKLLDGKEDLPADNRFIGYPVNIYRTFEVDGLWQDTEEDLAEMQIWFDSSRINYKPGQLKPVDQNGDYRLDDEDLVIRGSTVPKWTGGLTNSFTYKNFTLSAFIYARVGQKYYENRNPGGVFGSGRIGNAPSAPLSAFWSPDNPGAEWPKLTTEAVNTQSVPGTLVNDGTFFIVRNISLTYNVPGNILDRMGIVSLELFTQVLNPFIFGGEAVKAGFNPDDLNDWQPESDGRLRGGLNNNRIIDQSYVFGLRLGL